MLAQEDFEQLKLRFVDPIQHDYEAIRDIVLFAETASARSLQTGMERTVLRDKARRFIEDGMLGLADRRPGSAGRKDHVYPEPIAAYILYLKQLHPPIHLREIERILQRKFAYHTNHHTLKRFLERHASPVQLELNLTFFADFADAYQARWTVVRMAYEGWNQTSIAGCLKLSRRHVYNILKVFKKDGFAGLEDQRTGLGHMTVPEFGKNFSHTLHIAFNANKLRADALKSINKSCSGSMILRPLYGLIGRC